MSEARNANVLQKEDVRNGDCEEDDCLKMTSTATIVPVYVRRGGEGMCMTARCCGSLAAVERRGGASDYNGKAQHCC